jgi:hypothetical protein
VKAITEWEAPASVKAVRSFLGFANFYRQFIRNHSSVAAPLTELTRKDTGFRWTDAADKAFATLKRLFTTAPILLQFDPDRETVVETDSSGWAVGGVLSQYDDDGLLRPCAYFSKKNAPAECNYEIHDKELLAIIRCLQQWESELTSLSHFTIVTDHKNLRYFMTLRRLTERQMRWADILSRYNFSITYRPGKQNERSDALSRKEQDLPQDASDDRLRYREVQLLPTSEDSETEPGVIHMAPMTTRSQERANLADSTSHASSASASGMQDRLPKASVPMNRHYEPNSEPISGVTDDNDNVDSNQDATTDDPLEIALEHGVRRDGTDSLPQPLRRCATKRRLTAYRFW